MANAYPHIPQIPNYPQAAPPQGYAYPQAPPQAYAAPGAGYAPPAGPPPTANLFSGMGAAQVFGSGNYMEPGRYTLEITDVLFNRGHKGVAFIVEFKVIETTNTSKNADGTPRYTIGGKATWYQKMDQPAIAFPELKAFAIAANGVWLKDAATVDAITPTLETDLSAAVQQKTYNGRRVNVEVFAKAVKDQAKAKPGETLTFNKHVWSPYIAPAA